jgi:PIN domain nuclease of toxin-antitoxin system
MTLAVLDASALIALVRREPGEAAVRAVLARSAISVVNLSEVVGHFGRNEVAEADIRRVLDALPIERAPFDEELAYATGLLISATKVFGLSFGDRACLALARRLGVRAITADRAWASISALAGIEVEVIR